MNKVKENRNGGPSSEDFAALQAELETYRKEKESIREIIGQIGGNQDSRRDHVLNVLFIILLLILLACDVIGHTWPEYQVLPFQISIEVAVLMVSIKIIWMMHKQAKVEHFQFWILNSIEFRINSMSHQIADMKSAFDETRKD